MQEATSNIHKKEEYGKERSHFTQDVAHLRHDVVIGGVEPVVSQACLDFPHRRVGSEGDRDRLLVFAFGAQRRANNRV